MTALHGWPGVSQANPCSTVHCDEQPSALAVLPSSHASPPVIFLSPQTTVLTHAWPAVGQAKFGSTRHKPEQPSPGTALLSSHSSALSTLPLPQVVPPSPEPIGTSPRLPSCGTGPASGNSNMKPPEPPMPAASSSSGSTAASAPVTSTKTRVWHAARAKSGSTHWQRKYRDLRQDRLNILKILPPALCTLQDKCKHLRSRFCKAARGIHKRPGLYVRATTSHLGSSWLFPG